MKLIKILTIVFLLYFLTLVQTSFLVHFIILNYFFNLVLLTTIIWNIFEKPKSFLGLLVAGIGGFFLDIFSNHLIGFNILILLITAVFIKLVLRKYVRVPIVEKI